MAEVCLAHPKRHPGHPDPAAKNGGELSIASGGLFS
jgi:hypothetical protein